MSDTNNGAGRRIAVVTGGGNGIGEAISTSLAEAGHAVAILDYDGEGGKALASRLNAAGLTARFWQLDCTELDAVEGTFAEIREELGDPAYLVNNVGGHARTKATDFLDSDVRTLDHMVALNLKSTVYCSRQVVKAMSEARFGRIVSIASEAALTGGPKCWDYSAVKAGVIGFSRAIAYELAPHGINVNVVAPGATRTAALAAWSEEQKAAVARAIPLGRLGQPGEIAGTVAFLLSEEASFITGQTILANGGRWMV
ncbi:SDR family NAD(P)-dependent oxidoreductase [Henriciella mobilis]|nr:SDR family NAD(P)-dependent oxidoreductase [Henriciella mobilis]